MSDREDKIEREVLAHKLIAGTATQSERDNALATILLSLWTFEDLRRAFESWHTDKCAECPAKKHADKAEKERAENGGIVESMKRHAGIILWIITALVAVILKLTGATAPTL